MTTFIIAVDSSNYLAVYQVIFMSHLKFALVKSEEPRRLIQDVLSCQPAVIVGRNTLPAALLKEHSLCSV